MKHLKPLPEHVFFAIWKATFNDQLLILNARLAKAAELHDFKITAYSDDFLDFCIYIYEEQPDLIDYHQN